MKDNINITLKQLKVSQTCFRLKCGLISLDFQNLLSLLSLFNWDTTEEQLNHKVCMMNSQ